MEPEMMYAYLGGDPFLLKIGSLLKQFQFPGRGNMQDMQPGVIFTGQSDGK